MHQRFRTVLAAAVAATLTGGLLALAGTPATASPGAEGSVAEADFDRDGFRDLVVPTPDATVAGRRNAGAVTVLHGSPSGAGAARRTTVSRNTPGVPGTAERGERFGHATAVGDFDNDGYADLAVGVPHAAASGGLSEDTAEDRSQGTSGDRSQGTPGDSPQGTSGEGSASGSGERSEGSPGIRAAGSVQILWGSAAGLTGGTTLAGPAPTARSRFGQALAAGDFDGDRRTDLAVGTASATLRIFKRGIARTGTAGARQDVRTPVRGGTGRGIVRLTAGEVTADERTDLVVGGASGTAGAHARHANSFLPGSASGPDASRAKQLPAGAFTAIGDVNGDTYGDLVGGLPEGTGARGGRVDVVYGSPFGPTRRRDTITQESGALPGGSEAGDGFGRAVTLGDINGDGFQDLAVGTPHEKLPATAGTGSVTVVYGSSTGLNTGHVQSFHQGTPGVPGSPDLPEVFGGTVVLSDLTGDGRADLTVGADSAEEGVGSLVTLLSDGTSVTTAGAGALLRSPLDTSAVPAGLPRYESFISG
ncbi:FG-GAP and VCBS repeat-containing protein [Streptomyces sp. bgisy100]|uniref:FG-GAP and VCBS repeat-containing protein n=1 Tax=Streptomyces sp. bgisy100 TaxID=3413783 RepID=UPI003D746DF3